VTRERGGERESWESIQELRCERRPYAAMETYGFMTSSSDQNRCGHENTDVRTAIRASLFLHDMSSSHLYSLASEGEHTHTQTTKHTHTPKHTQPTTHTHPNKQTHTTNNAHTPKQTHTQPNTTNNTHTHTQTTNNQTHKHTQPTHTHTQPITKHTHTQTNTHNGVTRLLLF